MSMWADDENDTLALIAVVCFGAVGHALRRVYQQADDALQTTHAIYRFEPNAISTDNTTFILVKSRIISFD